jgi:hypothetical protein
MKLCRNDVSFPYHRGEGNAIFCYAGYQFVLFRRYVIGMDEIKERVVFYVFKNRRPFQELNGISAHMRHLEVNLEL